MTITVPPRSLISTSLTISLRVIRRRVRPGDDRQVGLVEIVEHERRRAAPEDARQRHAGGLVAVERAVVDVRGPVRAGERLHQERRLVRRPPRAVEEGRFPRRRL